MILKNHFVYIALSALIHSTLASSPEIVFEIAAKGHAGELKKVIASGVDINMRNAQGTTPLIKAVLGGNSETTRYLIESGADLSLSDSLGRDALDWALVSGSLEAARLLVTHGAEINRVDNKGNTRLIAAALRNDLTAVNFLLVHGADKDAKNSRGLTPLKISQNNKNREITRVITEFTPAPIAQGQSGLSPQDSLKLYAVKSYTDRQAFFSAVQSGRRSFAGCSLEEIDFSNMNLTSLDFAGANLSSADLRNARLGGSSLKGANLKAAYLKRANLAGTDLTGANLADAYLNETALRETKGVTIEQLRFVRTLYNAQLEEEIEQFFQERHPEKLQKDPGSAWDTNTWSQDAGKKSLRQWFADQPQAPADAQ